MDRTRTAFSDIDLFIFVQGETPKSATLVAQNAREVFAASIFNSWKLREDAAFLSTRVIRFSFECADMINVEGEEAWEGLRRIRLSLREFEIAHGIEVVFLPSTVRTSPPRIAVFDMDSTLIKAEVIDELARGIGRMQEVAAITDLAMNGHIDFEESLNLRVRLLRGVPTSIWDDLKSRINFMPGARELTQVLGGCGVKMAVLSGGFREMALWVGTELGLHRAAANLLVSSEPNKEFPYPHLTGQLDPDAFIVTAERKEQLLRAFAKENGVSLAQAICVGDGANDLQMLQSCGSCGGIAIAFGAKTKVQENAPNRLNSGSLIDILHLLSLDMTEIENLSKADIPRTTPILIEKITNS